MSERHAVVTGAGTGIGRAIALRLAGAEDAVTLLGLDAGNVVLDINADVLALDLHLAAMLGPRHDDNPLRRQIGKR